MNRFDGKPLGEALRLIAPLVRKLDADGSRKSILRRESRGSVTDEKNARHDVVLLLGLTASYPPARATIERLIRPARTDPFFIARASGDMSKPISAGTLLFRRGANGVEVLLVHPSGPYNRRAPWSIPKGLPDADEDHEHAARRETLEETGVTAGELTALGTIDYTKSRKTVVAFGGPAPDAEAPRCASWEVDRAEFVPVERAKELIHPDQRPFLERLLAKIDE
jgi:predicted NUDIX family NTP pyrophosphohydrolase